MHVYNVFGSSPPPYSLFSLLKSFHNSNNFSLPTPSTLPHWVNSSNLSHTSHNFSLQTLQHLALSSLNSACTGTSIEPFTGIWVSSFSSEVIYLKRTKSPFSKHQVPIAPQLGVGLPDFLPSPWWDFVWVNLAQVIATVSLCAHCTVVSRKENCFHCIHSLPSVLTISLVPLLQWSLRPWRRGYDNDIGNPFRAEYSASFYVYQLWISVRFMYYK